MDAAVAALLGTALGAVGSFGASWLQQRAQHRRERMKLASDIALSDYERRLELGGKMPPIAVFVAYQVELLAALDDGKLDDAEIRKLRANYEMRVKAFAQRD